MPRYFTLDGKRYKPSTATHFPGKMSKENKKGLIATGEAILVRESKTKDLGTKVKGERRRKCVQWADTGNRMLWSKAMKSAGGDSKIASQRYRAVYGVVSAPGSLGTGQSQGPPGTKSVRRRPYVEEEQEYVPPPQYSRRKPPSKPAIKRKKKRVLASIPPPKK